MRHISKTSQALSRPAQPLEPLLCLEVSTKVSTSPAESGPIITGDAFPARLAMRYASASEPRTIERPNTGRGYWMQDLNTPYEQNKRDMPPSSW